jgi:hypothetical protein
MGTFGKALELRVVLVWAYRKLPAAAQDVAVNASARTATRTILAKTGCLYIIVIVSLFVICTAAAWGRFSEDSHFGFLGSLKPGFPFLAS